jgi:hypothetical protein
LKNTNDKDHKKELSPKNRNRCSFFMPYNKLAGLDGIERVKEMKFEHYFNRYISIFALIISIISLIISYIKV